MSLWVGVVGVFLGFLLSTRVESAGSPSAKNCRSKIAMAHQGALSDFMTQMKALPHFSAEEEALFFKQLVGLEDSIARLAQDRQLISDFDLATRSKKVSTLIQPLLSLLKTKDERPDLLEIKTQLQQWDAMRDEFIRRNLGLVVSVSQRFQVLTLPLEYQLSDLVIMLNRAFNSFEPSYAFKFATYAYQSMQRGAARAFDRWKLGHHPSRDSEIMAWRLKKLDSEKQRLEGRHHTREEVAALFKIRPNRAQEIMDLAARPKDLSLDAELKTGDGQRVSDIFEAPKPHSNRSMESLERKVRWIEDSWQHITDELTRKVLREFSRGVFILEMSKEINLERRKVARLINDGLLATKAILAILSNRIEDEKAVLILQLNFGIFGFNKETNLEIARRFQMPQHDVKVLIHSVLKEIAEEDLDFFFENQR
jgi:DNA-directed RNA polymerase sigma subunit (sigma70/sigma32)